MVGPGLAGMRCAEVEAGVAVGEVGEVVAVGGVGEVGEVVAVGGVGEVVAVGGRVAGFAMIGMAGVEVARVAMRGMTWGEVGVQVEAGGSTDMEVCSGRDVAVVDEMSASNNMSRNVELFGLPVS